MKILLMTLLLFSELAFSVVLRDIDSGSDESKTITTIGFDKEYKEKYELKNEGSFIEIVLPNVSVEQPGTFYDAKSPFFTKIAPFQLNNNDAAIRFFVKENKLHIEKAIKIEISGNSIIVELDHKALNQKSDLSDATMPSADEVISKTTVRKNITDPVKTISLEEASTPAKTAIQPAKNKTLALKKYLNLVAIIGAFVMFGFLGFSFYRNRSGHVTDLMDATKDSIKTIASYPISQKQQLKLVEVAGEKILLGVSGENISYLKTLEEAPSAQPIAPKIVSKEPMQLQESARQELPLTKRAVNPNRQKDMMYKRDVQSTSGNESNIAMKMLSKQDQDFSDASNVEIQKPKKRKSAQASSKTQKAKSETKLASSVGNNKAVEDVTKLIRKKLQNLPKV